MLGRIESLLLLFGLLLISLSIHEAAHAWTANRLGDPTARRLGRITINPLAHIDWIGTVLFPLISYLSHLPLLGWAKPVPVDFRNLRHPRRDFAIVAAAGPASNLVLAGLGALVFNALYEPWSLNLPAVILTELVRMNILLAVFNMIPIPPLDGGNVLAGLLPKQLAPVLYQMSTWGFLILYALLFTGVLDRIVTPIHNSIFNVLMPAY